MTRFVIEQGQAARSITAPVRSGRPAAAASVRTLNRCEKGRPGLDLLRGICRSWQPAGDQGHGSPLAGALYGAPSSPSSVAAPG
ncbi:MAG TPA: hypothetical protein VFE42_05440 [Chloroflexota bacterium]|nr:hypothetical protein [Chloroflexota bacterium]